MMLMQLTAR
jgi:hypothetical protein